MKKTLLAAFLLSFAFLNVKAQETTLSANLDNNKVTLQWSVAVNETINRFEVEKSTDGTEFHTAALVFGSEKTGVENYEFPQALSGAKVAYRLKTIANNGVITYSKLFSLPLTASTIKTSGNTANNTLAVNFTQPATR